MTYIVQGVGLYYFNATKATCLMSVADIANALMLWAYTSIFASTANHLLLHKLLLHKYVHAWCFASNCTVESKHLDNTTYACSKQLGFAICIW